MNHLVFPRAPVFVTLFVALFVVSFFLLLWQSQDSSKPSAPAAVPNAGANNGPLSDNVTSDDFILRESDGPRYWYFRLSYQPEMEFNESTVIRAQLRLPSSPNDKARDWASVDSSARRDSDICLELSSVAFEQQSPATETCRRTLPTVPDESVEWRWQIVPKGDDKGKQLLTHTLTLLPKSTMNQNEAGVPRINFPLYTKVKVNKSIWNNPRYVAELTFAASLITSLLGSSIALFAIFWRSRKSPPEVPEPAADER
jgi:hypothetical protein